MLLSKEKTKEDYKKICLQLEYELYKRDKEKDKLFTYMLERKVEYLQATHSSRNNIGCYHYYKLICDILDMIKGDKNE